MICNMQHVTHHPLPITDGAAVTLIGEISFRGGIRAKGMHKSVKRITSARSRSRSKYFGKCLSLVMVMVMVYNVFILVNIPFALG